MPPPSLNLILPCLSENNTPFANTTLGENHTMHLTRRQFIGLMGALGVTSCARNPKDVIADIGSDGTFSFAVVGDLHILDIGSTAIVNRAVKDINSRKDIAFTVIAGDLATDGKLPELKLAQDSLDRLERPWFVIPGNHDVDPTNADEYANWKTTYGKTNWEDSGRGWAFIGLDSCDGTKSDVAIRPEELEWLDKRLNGINNQRPIALFVHHPFNPNSKAYRVSNADEVLARFENHNLKLVASGHYHGNQVEERDGTLFTTTACCSTTRPNFDGTEAKGYRVFHVTADHALETEFVEVPS